MSKSKILLEKLTSLLAQGLISYKDLSNEVINIIKNDTRNIIDYKNEIEEFKNKKQRKYWKLIK